MLATNSNSLCGNPVEFSVSIMRKNNWHSTNIPEEYNNMVSSQRTLQIN